MSTRRPHSPSSERGAALVEFALVAPVLVMIMMGIIQFGLLLHQQQGLHAAAREGARVGSVGADEAAIDGAVTAAINNINMSATPVVAITPANPVTVGGPPCDDTLATPPDNLTVNVQASVALDIPFLAGQTVNLIGEGTFRCEYLP